MRARGWGSPFRGPGRRGTRTGTAAGERAGRRALWPAQSYRNLPKRALASLHARARVTRTAARSRGLDDRGRHALVLPIASPIAPVGVDERRPQRAWTDRGSVHVVARMAHGGPGHMRRVLRSVFRGEAGWGRSGCAGRKPGPSMRNRRGGSESNCRVDGLAHDAACSAGPRRPGGGVRAEAVDTADVRPAAECAKIGRGQEPPPQRAGAVGRDGPVLGRGQRPDGRPVEDGRA